jgi:uncharacterized membrane protein
VLVFAVAFVVCRLWRPRTNALYTALRCGVGAMFAMTGIAHFVGMRGELVAMVPGWLPAPEFLVALTGVLELAAAAAMLIRPLVPYAALGLSVMLVAMFPANVHLALTGVDIDWWDQLLPRTLMQLVFLTATVALAVVSLRSARATRTEARVAVDSGQPR